MNAKNQPHTDSTTLEASSAERDFYVAGFGRLSQLEAIELARIANASGKKLFCRLPSPLKLTLQARLTAGAQ